MRRSLFALAFAVLAVLLGLNFAQAQACDDVRAFDFRDARIHVAATDDGEHSEPAAFNFQHGIAYLSDNPGSPQSRDWRVGVVVDRSAHLDPSLWIRVIVLDKNHLTGSGGWHYILAFDCRKGWLNRLFQYGSEGVTLRHLDSRRLQLYQAVWAPSDARCCPTMHADLLYEWNLREQRFVRTASIRHQGFEAVPDEK
jgi:hypothetical protein